MLRIILSHSVIYFITQQLKLSYDQAMTALNTQKKTRMRCFALCTN